MKLFKNFALALALIPMTAVAQEVSVTFDTEDYKSLGVYDTWEESPFRLGEMTGNWAVVDNDDKETVNEATGTILNASDKLLAVQRSRFGSNTFGARIDLKQTFELTTAYKYVHVLIKKPVEGRVMLIGLGKRQDRAGQSPRAEQFWSISNNKVAADTWTDAVFAINGNGGIDIHSLVVVPDMESPHERTSDFACFIDEIIVDNSSAPRFRIGGDYALNFENDVKTGRTDRALNSVSFSVPSKTGQSVTSTDGSDKSYLYYDRTGSTFYAKPGETVTPGISYTGSWMNGFVYIDWNSDGKFTNELNANYTPATGSEIVSFNAYSPNGSTWYKSTGATASNGNNIGSGVPTFTIPASQAVGFYRMRYKVDWNSLDAAGCNESGNLITNNGGAILDIMLNIHADEVTVNNANRNGDVLAADGTKLDNYKTAFGQSFTVKMVPENGFGYQGILLTHGYNLNGDSLVHSNAQYRTEYIDRALFTNDEYAIPAEYVDGDILIEGLFVEAGTEVDRTVTASGSHGEMTASDITSAVAKNGHVYVKMLTVSNSCTDYYMAYDKTQTYSDNVVLVIAPSSTDPTVYTIKNLGTGQYFGTANGTSSNSLTSVTTNEAEAATFNIVDRTSGADVAPYNDGTYKLVSFALSTVTSSTMYLNCNNADAHPKYFTGTGGFSLFCVYNVPETPSNEKYTVTYKVKDATGTIIKTSEQEVAKGSTYPAATTITSECSSTYYTLAGIPTSTVEKDTVVVLTYTENFPFEVTKDLAAAKVYRLMFTSDQFYLYNTTSDMALAATSEDTTSDKYGWYFMGNAFDGFQLFNVEAGTGYVLSSSTTMSGTSGGGTRPTLTALPVPTGNNSTWYVQTGSTINGQTGFFLGQTGYASNRMNYRDGYLSYWTGGTGNGSTFTLSTMTEKDLTNIELPDISGDPNSYAVIVNGGVTGGGVTYGGVSYAGNSVVKTQEGFEKADFSSIAVFGYVGNITIDRTAKTITVTYTDDPALDIFSTVENPRWFQVKFITGSNCIADQNTGNSTTAVNLITAASSKTAQAQQWQFIGDYNGFYMKSNLGNYVAYSGSRFTSLYIADDTNVASAQKLHLTKSGSGFEIQRYGVTATSVNQNGGTSAGVQLGDWAKGDTNNPLTFIPIEDTSIKFSTATNENYYLIKFCNSGLYMQDMGTGANVTTQSLARTDDSQYWKLVGTKDAFQLISKDGHYATYNGSRITTATTAPTSTFYLTTTTNTSYAGNYELGWSGVTTTQCYANQWGGTGAGTQLGLWTVGDVNNVIFFVDPTESSADEYEVEAGSRPTDIDDYSLWYDIPSTSTGVTDRWMEYALPMGNGQIGATLVGGVLVDEVQLNEKTLFEGTPTRSGNQGYYQNLGSIKVKDLSAAFSYAGDTTTPVKGYARYLDIVNGVAGVNYTSNDGNTQFKRHYFVSATDSVLVCDYEAVGDADLDILISLEADGQINASDVTYDETVATFRGSLSTVSYNARFDILTDGQKTEQANGIRVSGTKKATVIFSAITDYSTKSTTLKSGATATDLKNTVKRRIAAAKAKGYDALLADHTAKHSALMNRVKIDFGGASTMTTENLVKAYNQSTANKTNANGIFLEQLYFQYGRYMTIGANLDTSIHAPSNLQGIWNDRSNTSFWHCDIHADINVEMNYWPADPTNLSEMHLPFLEHIIDLSKEGFNWRTLAQAISGTSAPGWTVAVENNILGGTSTWENAHCKTLGAWYCSHLWRYYKYTCDKDFLIRALPVMYSAAEYLKYIATLDTDGTYVITEEFSPEHGNESTITAFAQQTAAELLSNILDADAELGAASPLTDAQVEEIRTFYNQFDKGLQVENYTWTRDGVTYTSQPCISEWKKISLTDPSHRHLSHLMCLFPYNQVSPYDADQTLFTAAKNGILARNGDVTGWSMGWQTNIYARCLQGDNARGYLSQALKHSTNYAIAMGGDGGCYYNLFDAHSPFQIDGNYGCTSGVAEMLLQSYDDVVTILPALPSAWATNGSAKGLKAVGNFIVDQTWENGKAKRVTIQSVAGSDLKVRMGEGSDLTGKDILVGGQKVTATKNADNTFSIPCEKGQKVEIYMDGITVVPGDVNANGEVSLSDLTTLIGIYRNTVSADGKYPDVDNNTEVTLDDITALVNIILGR